MVFGSYKLSENPLLSEYPVTPSTGGANVLASTSLTRFFAKSKELASLSPFS